METSSTHTCPPRRVSAFAGALIAVMLLLGACDGDEPVVTATALTNAPTATVTATSTTATTATTDATSPGPGTATSTPTPAPTEEPAPETKLRSLLLSGLTTGLDVSTTSTALEDIEVVAQPIEHPDRDLWIALTTGAGITQLDERTQHRIAIYERSEGGAWGEVASLPLESEPTIAEASVVPLPGEGDYPIWIAVHGSTGAHSGTFELVRFDGMALTAALWWFSPGPDAAVIEDADGDGTPEVALNATDPYVLCYACGVRAYSEILYRWVGDDLVPVNIGPTGSTQTAIDLTGRASEYVAADLWRRARSTMQLAVDAAPEDTEVRWLKIQIDRIAQARLDQAGSELHPLTTNVLAGEYEAAAVLMQQHAPSEVFRTGGPLFAGTAAEGWEEAAGGYLVDYATRAVALEPTLADAYAVRALGRVLVAADAWGEAAVDMEAALAIEPDNAFFREATEYLRAQASR